MTGRLTIGLIVTLTPEQFQLCAFKVDFTVDVALFFSGWAAPQRAGALMGVLNLMYDLSLSALSVERTQQPEN